MYGIIARIGAPVLLVLLLVQTARIDGVPIFYRGLVAQLDACEDLNTEAAKKRDEAIVAAREEGRVGAALAAQELVANEIRRRSDADKVIEDLRNRVSKLRPVAPPPIILPGQPEPPIIVTPPALPAVCRLDQGTLDSIRATLNAQRNAP